jgi:hypothetical protein
VGDIPARQAGLTVNLIRSGTRMMWLIWSGGRVVGWVRSVVVQQCMQRREAVLEAYRRIFHAGETNWGKANTRGEIEAIMVAQ